MSKPFLFNSFKLSFFFFLTCLTVLNVPLDLLREGGQERLFERPGREMNMFKRVKTFLLPLAVTEAV